MSEPKYITNPAKFLRESGLLFELNRQIFHPFGLAITIEAEDLFDEGDAVQIRIWDEREDKEGIVFSPDAFVNGMSKVNDFLEQFGIAKIEERREELGYITQEHPDPHMKKNGVTLFTYNPEYNPDDENSHDVVVFTVPYNWVESEVASWYDMDIHQFLDSYTYDEAEPLYKEAKEQGLIQREETIKDVL
jgi:hypothetical protein